MIHTPRIFPNHVGLQSEIKMDLIVIFVNDQHTAICNVKWKKTNLIFFKHLWKIKH